jgi:hypothetical protein
MSNAKNCNAGSRFYLIKILALVAGFICTSCQSINQNHTPRASSEIASAHFVMQISRELDGPEFAGIVSAIEYHPGNYPILSSNSHSRFSENLLDEYIGHFERVGVHVRNGMVNPIMACNELGYELLKAWCNNDVQTYVNISRKADADCSGSEACYGAFEELARFCMLKDNKTCSDIDGELVILQGFAQSGE